jgi:hypothetical protein
VVCNVLRVEDKITFGSWFDIMIFSRAVGYRFGPHLADTVPVLINYCTSASENDEELREYSLQVLIFVNFLALFFFICI